MRFAPPQVLTRMTPEGQRLWSADPLGPYARCVGDWLVRWAREAPDRPFLAERSGDGWRRVSYAEAHSQVRALGGALLARGASATRPVLLLSDNSVDHALVQLAAMHVGVPVAPLSPAYSLLSRDFLKLREVAACVAPGVVFAEDTAPFGPALDALGLDVPLLASRDKAGRATRLDALRHRPADAAVDAVVDAAFAAVGPDTVAKILFTSGSTGAPKGVVNTQRMLCSNQQAIAQVWPLLHARPPVVVDWLPWSHTFGGNHNFHMVLAHGGTLYVDPGRPAPGRIEATVASLRDVQPTLSFNVPRGFDMLLPFLEQDAALAARFFGDLDLVFYAAAALPQSTWTRLEAVARRVRPEGVPFTAAWGLTETSPLVTSVHFPIARAGVIGAPVPGCELKLAVQGDRTELRVRGPNVTPGYWTPGGGLRPVALDEEGFFATGDAARLEDPADPNRGVVFDGRIAENFKLTTGTWVSVGDLRVRVIAACSPWVQDAVVTGHDRDAVGVMVFAAPGASAADVRTGLERGLRAHNQASPGTSARVARALVLAEPPQIDRGETTDKGYLNQRALLTHRAAEVARLHAAAPDPDVLVL